MLYPINKEVIMLRLVQFGVIKNRVLVEDSPTHSIVLTCIRPGVVIDMKKDIFLVYTKYSTPEEAERKQHSFEADEQDYLRAGHAGEMVVKLMHRLKGTEGLNYLHVLPTGLVSYLWPDKLKFAPAIIERMRKVLTEVCGEFHFFHEPNVRVPTSEQIEASRSMGILLPI